jgi:aspartate aminotransferase-like enzyme
LKDVLLMIPGPTNISDAVRRVMGEAQVGHSEPRFQEKFAELVQLARYAFRNDAGFQYVFTGTGTVAMEAAVAAAVEPGDRTLVLNTGYFGHRWTEINQVYGAKVEEMTCAFGKHADPVDVKRKLEQARYEAVFITHVDTGTTVVNPIEEIVRVVKRAGALALVDGVCSVGGIEMNFDKLGADLVMTGSQKAIAAPPGGLLIATSKTMEEGIEKRKTPIRSYYANLQTWKKVMSDPKVYFATHATQLMLAVRQALLEVKEEGIENRWNRHVDIGKNIRSGLEKRGIEMVAESGFRADTVTGFLVPGGKAPEVQKALREKHMIEVARGLGDYSSKMIRVGHFGILRKDQIEYFFDALDETLQSTGVRTSGLPAR